jgi:hypothetical protein
MQFYGLQLPDILYIVKFSALLPCHYSEGDESKGFARFIKLPNKLVELCALLELTTGWMCLHYLHQHMLWSSWRRSFCIIPYVISVRFWKAMLPDRPVEIKRSTPI